MKLTVESVELELNSETLTVVLEREAQDVTFRAVNYSIDEGDIVELEIESDVEIGAKAIYNFEYTVVFAPTPETSGYNYLRSELNRGENDCGDTDAETRCRTVNFARTGLEGNRKWAVNFILATKREDIFDHEGGTITITLTRYDGLTPNATTLDISVIDSLEGRFIPSRLITFENSSTTILEGQSTTLRIFSIRDPGVSPYFFTYRVTEVGNTNYLDVRNGASGADRQFAATFEADENQPGRFFTSVTIKTNRPDEIDFGDGQIEVTLHDQDFNDVLRVDTSNNLHTITVVDSIAGVGLSIEASTNLITEGTTASFLITADIFPGREFEIQYKVVFMYSEANQFDENYLVEEVDDPFVENEDGNLEIAGITKTLAFTEFGAGARTILDIPTRTADSTDLGGGTVEIQLEATTEGRISMNEGSASVTIIDTFDDNADNLLSRMQVNFGGASSNITITEGNELTLNLISSVNAPERTEVDVHVTQVGDFITFVVPKAVFEEGENHAELEILTNDDLIDEENGQIIVTILESSLLAAYGRGTDHTRIITVEDNDIPNQAGTRHSIAHLALLEILDNPPAANSEVYPVANSPRQNPIVSISTSQPVIEEGQVATIQVSSNESLTGLLRVHLELTDGFKLVNGELKRTVVLNPQWGKATVTIQTIDDNIPEAEGEITATIVEGGDYEVGTQDRVSIRVTDNVDVARYERRAVAVNSAVTPVILAAMGERNSDAVANRTELAFSGSNQYEFTLGGQSSVSGMIVSSGRKLNGDLDDLKSKLANSSFSFNLFPEVGHPGSSTVWGVGSSGFVSDNGRASSISWNGGMSIGQVGFDSRVGESLLVGTSASVLDANVKHSDRNGEVLMYETQFTGIHPYLGFMSTSGDTRLQITSGYATGDLGIYHPEQVPDYVGAGYQMAALDGKHNLHADDSPVLGSYQLNLTGKSFMARQYALGESGFTSGLRASTSQFQLATEFTNEQMFSPVKLTPAIAVGIRGNAVNGQSLVGMHLTSGMDIASEVGLKLSSSGSTLLTGHNSLEDVNLDFGLSYDQHQDKSGVYLDFSANWMQRGAVGKSLYHNGSSAVASDLLEGTIQREGLLVEGEIKYGIDILDNSSVLLPGVGMTYSRSQSVEYTVGGRLDYQDHHIDLTATRKFWDHGSQTQRLRLGGNYQW